MVPNGTAYAEFPSFADSGTRVKPSPDSRYAQGFVPGDTFPAEWENYFMHGATAGITRLNADTLSIKEELNNILSEYGITPNASAINQLYTVLRRIAPQICTCDTAAGTETKSVAITGDGTTLKAGNIYSITMTHENTYGNGSSTYPKLSINSGTAYPMCDARGAYLKSGAWAAGDVVTVLFTGSKFLMSTASVDAIENGNQNAVTSNAVSCIIAANTTVTGPRLGTGGNIKIMFTADITGSDTTTPLSISYNGTTYAVKVCKNGAKAGVFAHEVATDTYKFLQAYTTLELVYDGTDLVIVGNPIAISTSDYTIYTNGLIEYKDNYSTTETFTGKYWIDGKPIYRRVYSGLSIVKPAGFQWDATGLDAPSSVGEIVNALLYFNDNDPSYEVAAPFPAMIGIKKEDNKLYYLPEPKFGGKIISILIEYTKTTD